MLATLAVALTVTQSPELESKLQPIIERQVNKPDFDRDVLTPLKQTQAEKAAAAAKAAQEALEADLRATADRMQPTGTYGNPYYYLQCTWYVASRIPVHPYLGNANTWDNNLAAMGWRQGPPRRGAIAVTDAGWWGHVAVVEQVSGESVLISEYNYIPYSYTERWVHFSEFTYLY